MQPEKQPGFGFVRTPSSQFPERPAAATQPMRLSSQAVRKARDVTDALEPVSRDDRQKFKWKMVDVKGENLNSLIHVFEDWHHQLSNANTDFDDEESST